MRPFSSCLARSFSLYALPFSAASRLTSLRTTSMPALAETYAMPAPIMPAPMHGDLGELLAARCPSGREPPALIAPRSKKNACVMFLNC